MSKPLNIVSIQSEPTEDQKGHEEGFNGGKRRSLKAKAFFSVRFELHFFVLSVPSAFAKPSARQVFAPIPVFKLQ
jgi:hypothetical protein